MKNLILLLLVSTTLFAQQDKVQLVGQILDAKITFVTGETVDGLMMYQPPEFFRNPRNTFTISHSKDKDKILKETGTIVTFMIDNTIWALRPSPVAEPTNSNHYVRLIRQGAIESYEFITTEPSKTERDYKGVTLNGTITHKLDGQRYMATEMKPNYGYEREWISDAPEIVEELRKADSVAQANEAAKKSQPPAKKKGLLGSLADLQSTTEQPMTYVDMTTILNNYNAWYETKNPGKIKYCFVDPPMRKKSQVQANQEKLDQQNKPSAAAAIAITRPAAVSPELASAKDDAPVKKETFAGKLDRIKGDGNKVGVLYVLKPVTGSKNESSGRMNNSLMNQAMGSSDITLDGEYLDTSLQSLGSSLTADLNAALGRTDIELIDLSNIPVRTVKVMGNTSVMDDWWKTKYKVVFAYTVEPRITATHQTSDGKTKFQSTLNFVSSLVIREYIGPQDSYKQDIMVQALSFGGFDSAPFTQDEDIKDIKSLYEKHIEKLGMPLSEKINTLRSADLKTVVAKKLTP